MLGVDACSYKVCFPLSQQNFLVVQANESSFYSEDGPHSLCILYLPRTGQQRLLSRLYQRVRTPVAFPAEIVIVDGPEHDATQSVVTDVPRLWTMPELQYE